MPEIAQIINYLIGGFVGVGVLVIGVAGFIWNVFRIHKNDNKKAHDKIGKKIDKAKSDLETKMENGFREMRGYLVDHLEHHT